MIRPTDSQLASLGASLREIDPTTLMPDDEGAPVRWYLGDAGTELFAWIHGQSPPHHVQLVFSRVSVEWSVKDGLTTGTFQTGSSTAGGRYDPYLLTVGQRVDTEVARAALTLLRASKVDPVLMEPLVKALESPP